MRLVPVSKQNGKGARGRFGAENSEKTEISRKLAAVGWLDVTVRTACGGTRFASDVMTCSVHLFGAVAEQRMDSFF